MSSLDVESLIGLLIIRDPVFKMSAPLSRRCMLNPPVLRITALTVVRPAIDGAVLQDGLCQGHALAGIPAKARVVVVVSVARCRLSRTLVQGLHYFWPKVKHTKGRSAQCSEGKRAAGLGGEANAVFPSAPGNVVPVPVPGGSRLSGSSAGPASHVVSLVLLLRPVVLKATVLGLGVSTPWLSAEACVVPVWK